MNSQKYSFLKIVSITLIIFLSTRVYSQIDYNNVRDGEKVEYCKQHKVLAQKLQNPLYQQQYLKDQHELQTLELQLKTNPNQTRAVYYIPVVFHVLQIGGNENISDEQIHDAIRVLNKDYRLLNTDAANVQPEFNASNPNRVAQPADIEIEFRLATKAPDGTCFGGITRTFSSATNDGDGGNQVDAIKQGNDVYRGEWPGNEYLNVFVVNNADGAAGYTNYPSNWGGGIAMTNGIWILHNYVGAIGTSGTHTSRALTHEVGHWLNLPHVWGSTNNPGLPNNCNSDDGVDDTPNTIGVKNCKLNENSCGSKANVENYMDYSYCSKMFTEGQRDRMRAAIISSVGGRSNIISAANLAAVGADGNLNLCRADFDASNHVVCPGTVISFKDKSINYIQSRLWEFEGGSPATSTDKYPEITYNNPGIYKVTLTVSDGTTSLTKIDTNYIVVQENTLNLPYYEGFENYNSISDITNYQFFNGDTDSKTWEITSNASNSGNKSIYVQNYKQNGDVDAFISPTIDLSNESIENGGVTLSFRYAAAKKKSSQISETLQVLISNNCGESYVLRKTLNGTLLTSNVSSSNWTPTESDWKTIHMTNITSSFMTNNFRFKFSYESNGGNNVYIDDINLYSGNPSDEVVLGIGAPTSNINAMSIYPNPTNAELHVSFSAMNSGKYSVQIIDVVGEIIHTYFIQTNEGMNEVLINTDNLMNGAYFIKVADNVSAKTLKFIKQ